MNENEEIISLLRSINQHLEGLDEAMQDMKEQIDYLSDVVYQKDTNEKFESEYRASHPEEFEEKPDPGIQAILKKLNVINQNIVTGDSNQRIRHENADNALDAIRDELQDYYRGIVRTIEALRERMF